MSICYMCEKRAVSKDHAPPKCLFPEGKDWNGVDMRKNLITVPSCHEHNMARSQDDEYLLLILASSVSSGPVGMRHFLSKAVRTLMHSPKHISGLLPSDVEETPYFGSLGIHVKGHAINVDGARVDRVLKSTALALYYTHTRRQFKGVIRVVASFLFYQDAEANRVIQEGTKLLIGATEGFPSHGNNPEVFNYRFLESEHASMVIVMNFYQATSVLVNLTSEADPAYQKATDLPL